ncbi:MAG: hypothetical protein ACJ8EB_14275 [Allosphingosinicella sp.]
MRPLNFSPLLAAITAGPVFILSMGAAMLYLQLPRPIIVPLRDVPSFILILQVAAMVSLIVALIPALIATHLLAAAGECWPAARDTGLWLAAGMLVGAAPPLLDLGSGALTPAILLPWALTGAWTAWMCRRGVEWD